MTDVEGGLDEPDGLQPPPGHSHSRRPIDEWTRADWEKAAAAVLRKSRLLGDDDPDAAAWQALTRTTYDGIAISPLGTPDLLDDLATSGRPTRIGGWEIRSEVSTNADALVDLDGGVTSLWLRAGSAPDWATLLDGVLLDLAPVVLDGVDPEGFLAYADGRELAAGTNLGFDARAATGEQAALATRAGVLGFVVDATVVHDQGASDVQELGYAMSVGAQALRALTDAGLPIDDAAALIEFRLAVTDEQFPTIAKLRAARRLWARVLELSGAGLARHAPARRDEPPDDERLRPVGEHAAHHRRRLRGRRRGSGRDHRACPSTAHSVDPTRSGAGSRATPAHSSSPSPTSPGSPTPPAVRTPSRSSPTTSRSRPGSCSAGWTRGRT